MRHTKSLPNDEDIDLTLATFERLKSRISELEADGHHSIRNDTIANNYIETLNRLRDCFEQKLDDT